MQYLTALGHDVQIVVGEDEHTKRSGLLTVVTGGKPARPLSPARTPQKKLAAAKRMAIVAAKAAEAILPTSTSKENRKTSGV